MHDPKIDEEDVALPLNASGEAEKKECLPVPSSMTRAISRRDLLRRLGFGSATTALLLGAFPERGRALPSRVLEADGSAARAAIASVAAEPLRVKSLRLDTPSAIFQLPHWGDGGSWDSYEYSDTIQAMRRKFPKTIQTGDLDGDGRDELIARGPGGILANKYDPVTGQWQQLPAGPDWSDKNGWDDERYYATIQMADIDGDGRAELIGRASSGIQVWKFNPDPTDPFKGSWQNITPIASIFTDSEGWIKEQYYWTIQCADINGDGKAELIGRAPKTDPNSGGTGGMVVLGFDKDTGTWYNLPQPLEGGAGIWSDAKGWNSQVYWLSIQCADIDGDGVPELVGRASDGLNAWEFHPDPADPTRRTGTWSKLPINPALSDASGFSNYSQYCTVQCVDIDGDGQAELLARSSGGVLVWKYRRGVWHALTSPPAPLWSDANNWTLQEYAETIQGADIDGDGRWELLGRAADGMEGWKYFPTGDLTGSWLPIGTLTEFSDFNGVDNTYWDEIQHYRTIQAARILKPGDRGYSGDGANIQMALLGRSALCLQTWVYDAAQGQWGTSTAPFPSFTGSQLTAYQSIGSYFDIDTDDIRSLYNDIDAAAAGYALKMYGEDGPTNGAPNSGYDSPPDIRAATVLTTPPGVSTDDWNAVVWQIYWELIWVGQVATWFNADNMGYFVNKDGIGDIDLLNHIGDQLQIDDDSTTEIVLSSLILLASAAASIAGIPVLELEAATVATIGAVAGTFSASTGFALTLLPGSGAAYKQAYNRLRDDQITLFQNAANGNDSTKKAVMTSYGLLRVYGDNVRTLRWRLQDIRTKLVNEGLRGYATSIFQSLIPVVPWYIWYWADTEDEPMNTYFPDGYPPQYGYVTPTLVNDDGDSFSNVGLWFSEASSRINAFGEIPSALNTLFDPATDESWTPMGLPTRYAFTGKHGWPVMTWWNIRGGRSSPGPIEATPPASPSLLPDPRIAVTLQRDTLTNEIVAQIATVNHGMGPVANVEIIGATLNARPAITPLPQGHKRLKRGASSITEVRFANISGSAAVLRIAGRHKDGTFGTSLRVKLP